MMGCAVPIQDKVQVKMICAYVRIRIHTHDPQKGVTLGVRTRKNFPEIVTSKSTSVKFRSYDERTTNVRGILVQIRRKKYPLCDRKSDHLRGWKKLRVDTPYAKSPFFEARKKYPLLRAFWGPKAYQLRRGLSSADQHLWVNSLRNLHCSTVYGALTSCPISSTSIFSTQFFLYFLRKNLIFGFCPNYGIRCRIMDLMTLFLSHRDPPKKCAIGLYTYDVYGLIRRFDRRRAIRTSVHYVRCISHRTTPSCLAALPLRSEIILIDYKKPK